MVQLKSNQVETVQLESSHQVDSSANIKQTSMQFRGVAKGGHLAYHQIRQLPTHQQLYLSYRLMHGSLLIFLLYENIYFTSTFLYSVSYSIITS